MRYSACMHLKSIDAMTAASCTAALMAAGLAADLQTRWAWMMITAFCLIPRLMAMRPPLPSQRGRLRTAPTG